MHTKIFSEAVDRVQLYTEVKRAAKDDPEWKDPDLEFALELFGYICKKDMTVLNCERVLMWLNFITQGDELGVIEDEFMKYKRQMHDIIDVMTGDEPKHDLNVFDRESPFDDLTPEEVERAVEMSVQIPEATAEDCAKAVKQNKLAGLRAKGMVIDDACNISRELLEKGLKIKEQSKELSDGDKLRKNISELVEEEK